MKHSTACLPHYYPADEFYAQVKKRMKHLRNAGQAITLVTLDFDHFNYVNDMFGYETGDLVLEKITRHFSAHLRGDEIFSRIHADHFAFCIDTTQQNAAVRRFTEITDLQALLKSHIPTHYSLIASSGMITVEDDSVSLSSLLDKANYARKKAKGGSSTRLLFYSDKMDAEVEWQKAVTLTMEAALKNREFEMYLQPKVLIQTGQAVGAEALVRWNNPHYGLVAPLRFIPIMEQNGFVCQLDFFILEEACRFLRTCLDNGQPALPISVNFSKVHIASERLVERIAEVVSRMELPTHLIEIEFTESVFSDDFERLVALVTDLKQHGFRVSLDDFGSAYSSLNCLKELPIDVVKIDKGFLLDSANSEKGKLIIAKTVELVKSLRKISVMEGIETSEQADFLAKLCCDVGQGFFYSKPMPVANYLQFLQNQPTLAFEQPAPSRAPGNEAGYIQTIPHEFQMDNWELYTLGRNIDMGLLKGALDGDPQAEYVNDRTLEYLGYTRQEFHEFPTHSIAAFVHPDDRLVVKQNAQLLMQTGKPLSFQVRAVHKSGETIICKGRASCVTDSQGRHIGIYAFQDVTQEIATTAALEQSLQDKISELESTVASERQMRDALRLSEERYRVIMDQSDDVMFEWDFESDFINFSSKYTDLFGTSPITDSIMTNPAAREKIHPDDRPAFAQWLEATYQKNACTTAQFRVRNDAGEYIWVRYRSTAICNEEGEPIKAVGVFANITAQRKELESLTLKSQMDPLTKLFNKEETCVKIENKLRDTSVKRGAFFMIDIDNFKGLNDNLGHQLGDKVLVEIAQKLCAIFPHGIIGRVGGDEFVVYDPGCTETAALALAGQITQALHIKYYGSATRYDISGSVGIALYPAHACTFSELYRLADIALYESKRAGKDKGTVYHSGMTGALQSTQTPVEWTESFLSSYFQNDFPFQVFQMLYETKDVNASIGMILELLGTRYGVDRVYIFQTNSDARYTSNTFEWCAAGITPQKENLQNLPLDTLKPYFSMYNSEGVLHCTDTKSMDASIYAICAPQGIQSMLHCAILNEGDIVGFIGFDMCTAPRSWTGEEIAILGYISRILSVFLIKKETATELRTSYKNYVEMLENLNGFVYVIDPKTYELLYVNSATRSLGITLGSTCHKAAFGMDTPCPNCPINKFSDTMHYNTEEIYSQVLHRWVNSAASKLKWEGVRDAVLLCCTDISKYKLDGAAQP